MATRPELNAEDQRRVDEFVSTGIHSVQRKPFRPLVLLLIIVAVTTSMTVLSIVIEKLYIP